MFCLSLQVTYLEKSDEHIHVPTIICAISSEQIQ